MQVIHDVATVLDLVHSAGLVHGNVKPSHIILHPKTHAWTLIDFSTASNREPYLESALPYAAPEVLAPRYHVVMPGLDAWSLGVIAYELLTGKPWAAELDDHLVLLHLIHIGGGLQSFIPFVLGDTCESSMHDADAPSQCTIGGVLVPEQNVLEYCGSFFCSFLVKFERLHISVAS